MEQRLSESREANKFLLNKLNEVQRNKQTPTPNVARKNFRNFEGEMEDYEPVEEEEDSKEPDEFDEEQKEVEIAEEEESEDDIADTAQLP